MKRSLTNVVFYAVIAFAAAVTFAQPNPDTLWTHTYGGSGYDGAGCIQQTADGGYILTGTTDSFGAGLHDFYLVKTDSQGQPLWTRTYGGNNHDRARCVQQTSDGGYILAGTTWSFGAGIYDLFVVKTNALGDTLWTHTYGGNYENEAFSVRQTADGGYVVCGLKYSVSNYNDAYIVKTDSQGNPLWTRTYGGRGSDIAYSIRQTADGGYIAAGGTSSYGTGIPVSSNCWLLKTNRQGDTLWTRTYGGS
ncbi:hypothetical protein EHM69_12945, partial [candidate division KSB1 bacterium]